MGSKIKIKMNNQLCNFLCTNSLIYSKNFSITNKLLPFIFLFVIYYLNKITRRTYNGVFIFIFFLHLIKIEQPVLRECESSVSHNMSQSLSYMLFASLFRILVGQEYATYRHRKMPANKITPLAIQLQSSLFLSLEQP